MKISVEGFPLVPVTSFIPPQMLGVDLYQAIGLDLDPKAAKAALNEAGFSDLSKFPKVEIVFYEKSADLVKAYQEMWKTALGVEVTLVSVKSGEELTSILKKKNQGYPFWEFGSRIILTRITLHLTPSSTRIPLIRNL